MSEIIIQDDLGLWDVKEAIKQITHDGLLDTIKVMNEPNYDLKLRVQTTINKMEDVARINGMFERAVALGQVNNPDTSVNWIAWARRNDFKVDHLNKLINKQESTDTVNKIPGDKSKIAIAQIVVKTAWEIEQKNGRRATSKVVMHKLMEWAANGQKYSDVLHPPPIGFKGSGVYWITNKGEQRFYALTACEKALSRWYKTRQEADSNPSR